MGCNASTPSNTEDNALGGHVIREVFDPHPALLDKKKTNKKGSMTEPKKKREDQWTRCLARLVGGTCTPHTHM